MGIHDGGEKCDGIKNEYLMRADRAIGKTVHEPGTVSTRDLFCCCPFCLVGNFTTCEFLAETGSFRRQNWTRKLRVPVAPKKSKIIVPASSEHSTVSPVGGPVDTPVFVALAGAGVVEDDFFGGGGPDFPAAEGESLDENFDGDAEDLGVEEFSKLPPQCEWVQCSKRTCLKWKRLADGDDGTWCVSVRRWQCNQNDWDDFDSCDVDEEIYNVA